MTKSPSGSQAVKTFLGDLDPLEQYLREIKLIPRITHKREIELAKRLAKGDKNARKAMIVVNLLLVVKIAKDYSGMGLPLLDIINEGNIGLIKGIEHFRPGKGAVLSTCVRQWIKGAIKKALNREIRTIRIPSHMVYKLSRWRKSVARLQYELEREPTDEDVAHDLNLSSEQVKEIRMAELQTVSLDSPIYERGETAFIDIIRDEETKDPYENAAHRSELARLPQFLAILSEREQKVLSLRFGLVDNSKGLPYEKNGQILGVSRERAHQLHDIALDKIRAKLAGRAYRPKPWRKQPANS